MVTIEADSTSAIYREDSADFTLTRTGTLDDTLTVTVNLTQDQSYLTAANLSRTVTFAQHSATAALQVPASQFRQLGSGTVAEKGTLTATVADGTEYNVGTTSSAEVDIVIAATIRISESSYTISEEGGSTLTVTVVVRTGEGAPQPAATITVALGTFATGSAMSPEDYDATSVFMNFMSSDFSADGTVYKAEKSLDITIYDDSIDDNDETFDIRLQAAPGLHIKYWWNFVNSAGQRCGSTCTVTATITDTDPVVANITGVEFASSPAQHDSYSAGETVTVAATFDEAVEVDTTNGTPTLAIEVGSEMRSAAYTETSADGTTVSFSYTVVGSDHDENGIDVPAGHDRTQRGHDHPAGDERRGASHTWRLPKLLWDPQGEQESGDRVRRGGGNIDASRGGGHLRCGRDDHVPGGVRFSGLGGHDRRRAASAVPAGESWLRTERVSSLCPGFGVEGTGVRICGAVGRRGQ